MESGKIAGKNMSFLKNIKYLYFIIFSCIKYVYLYCFQMYISLVGPKYSEMTKSANMILQKYYMAQRKSEHRDASRTTVRMLDSLVR